MNVIILATLLAILFIAIGIYAYRRKEAMWFWSSPTYQMQQVKFRDTMTFNHKTGIMWILFGIAFFLPTPIRYLKLIKESVFIMMLSCILTIGLLSMMMYWHHLYQTYRK